MDDLSKKTVNSRIEIERSNELKKLEEQKSQLELKLEEVTCMSTSHGSDL